MSLSIWNCAKCLQKRKFTGTRELQNLIFLSFNQIEIFSNKHCLLGTETSRAQIVWKFYKQALLVWNSKNQAHACLGLKEMSICLLGILKISKCLLEIACLLKIAWNIQNVYKQPSWLSIILLETYKTYKVCLKFFGEIWN